MIEQASGGEPGGHTTAPLACQVSALERANQGIKQYRVMYGGIGCWRYPEAGVGSDASPYRGVGFNLPRVVSHSLSRCELVVEGKAGLICSMALLFSGVSGKPPRAMNCR
jgi:hypothetical protein